MISAPYLWLLLLVSALCGAIAIAAWMFLRSRKYASSPTVRCVVMENIEDLVVVLDTRGRIIDCNRAAQAAWDIPPPLPKSIPPETLPPAWAALFESYRGIPACKEEVTIGAGEARLVYDLTISSIQDTHRKIQGRLFLFHDITRHKRTEENLLVKERAIASSINAIAISNLEGDINYVNPSFLKLWGYRDQLEVLGRNTLEFWQMKEETREIIKTLQGRGGWMGESVARRKDGSTFEAQISASMILDAAGRPSSMLTALIDITGRKQTEAALRESEERYRTLFDNMMDGVYRSTHAGKFVDVNPAMVKIFGYASREEMLEVDIKKELYFSEGDRNSLFLDTGQEKIEVFRMRRKDGSEVWVEDHGHYVHDQDGNVIFHEGILRDVTERKRSEEIVHLRLMLSEFAATHSLEETMQAALDEIGEITGSPIGFYHFLEPDQKTISLQAWSTRTRNEFCQAQGAGAHYDLDKAGVWTDCIRQRKPVIHNDYASLPHRRGLPAGHAEVIRELVVPILRRGQVVSILGIGNKPTNYDERDVELVSYIADVIWEIVERKRTEEKLRQLSRAVEQSPASIVITDMAGKIEYVNPKFSQVTGYSLEESLGQNPRILKTDKTPRETHRHLWEALAAGREWRGEFVNRKKNGELYYESASISPITDNYGVTTHYLAVKEDITPLKHNEKKLRLANRRLKLQLNEIKRLQAELREQAIRDPLTGLHNRRYLDETLEREMARARREGYAVSFIMLDVDHFKNVNDNYGHEIGDKVLQRLATLLIEQTRAGDIICRYGGEEFLIVLPNTLTQAAFQTAERWRKTFRSLKMAAAETEFHVTISAGVASYPDHGSTSKEILMAADNAMYQAKARGRNRVVAWKSNP